MVALDSLTKTAHQLPNVQPNNSQTKTGIVDEQNKTSVLVPKQTLRDLAKVPFNLDNAAKVLVSSLSQNGGKVEGLEVFKKNTQQGLTQNKETDTFIAKFKETPIVIEIEKDLIKAADGGSKNDKVAIPNKVSIASEQKSISISSEQLGGKTGGSYIGEGSLNVINYNLDKLVPKK